MTAVLGLIAAVAAALIARSVMVSNHRQAWINGLREDLAAFFAAIDLVHATTTSEDANKLDALKEARNDAVVTFRRILMRLNMNEPLHQELEKLLESLLAIQGAVTNQVDLKAAVQLARKILKREWEVTKYGAFTWPIVNLKLWWRRHFCL